MAEIRNGHTTRSTIELGIAFHANLVCRPLHSGKGSVCRVVASVVSVL